MNILKIGQTLADRGHEFHLLISSADQYSRQKLESRLSDKQLIQVVTYMMSTEHFKPFQSLTDSDLKNSRDATQASCRSIAFCPKSPMGQLSNIMMQSIIKFLENAKHSASALIKDTETISQLKQASEQCRHKLAPRHGTC